MDRKKMITDIQKTTGASFITKRELANVMGIKDVHHVYKYFTDLEAVSGKYYYIPDVVDSLQAHAR